MSGLYENLCTVRTSIMNVIAHSYFDGKQRNVAKVLKDAAEELSDDEFMDDLYDLDVEELLDLGFEPYCPGIKDRFLLFPVWLLPFIPEGTVLETLDGTPLEIGLDTVSPYADHWLCVGIRADMN